MSDTHWHAEARTCTANCHAAMHLDNLRRQSNSPTPSTFTLVVCLLLLFSFFTGALKPTQRWMQVVQAGLAACPAWEMCRRQLLQCKL